MSSPGLSVLVGTTKGAFLISGGRDRSGWSVKGPFCDGWPINHMIGDPQSGTIWAGGGGDWHGAGVWRSSDGGESWEVARLTKGTMDDWAANDAGFAEMIGWKDEPLPFTDGFAQIWSLGLAHGTLYAGTKPAEPAEEHGRRQDMGAGGGPDQSPLGRKLEPRCGGAGPAHDRGRSGRSEKALGRDLGGRGLRDRGRRRDLGTPQPPVQCRGLRAP